MTPPAEEVLTAMRIVGVTAIVGAIVFGVIAGYLDYRRAPLLRITVILKGE